MSALEIDQYFDVHNFVKKAKEFGVNEQFAEYEARQFESAINNVLKNTKKEYKEFFNSKEIATKLDIKELELKIENVKNDLLKWQVGIGVTTIITLCGAIFTMLKLMLHI